MRAPRVVVGYHTFGTVHNAFCKALARAVAYEGNRIDRVLDFVSPYTEDARNHVVTGFLDGTTADYLLMVDADIEFERDSISKTMWVAQNFNADVVWGNYALGTFGNSIFTQDNKSDWALILNNLKPNMVYQDVYAGGTGWCLMTRSILERMRKEYPGPWHWFGRDLVMGPDNKEGILGEDIGFGRRVSKLKDENGKRPLQIGYTGVILIHHKFHSTVPEFMVPITGQYVGNQALTPVRNQNEPGPVAKELSTFTPDTVDPVSVDPNQAAAVQACTPEISPVDTAPDGASNGTDVHSHQP